MSPNGMPWRTALLLRSYLMILLLFGLPLIPPAPARAEDDRERRINEILTNLERRNENLKDIQCRVRLVEEDRINLSTGTKSGKILFLMAEPNPLFLIHFERGERDGLINRQEWYLFDSRWLHEGIERLKQVTRREIARPGEKLDLFDFERTPFPLPFGQKKETILRHFDVTLAKPGPSDPPDTDHLVCVPKPDGRLRDDYDRLEFFIHREVHLPSRIVATKNDGLEVVTADFPDLSPGSLNTNLSRDALRPPSVWEREKYKVVEERLPPPE